MAKKDKCTCDDLQQKNDAYVYLMNPTDIIIENGIGRIKRKYGKFTRPAIKVPNWFNEEQKKEAFEHNINFI